MGGPSLILNILGVLTVFQISGAQGVNIQFFEHENFTGLLYQSSSTAACNNVPKNMNTRFVYSIRSDTCFIAYSGGGCSSVLSVKLMPGDIVQNKLGGYGYIKSFHTCNEEEGGQQLNVDITSEYSLTKPSPKLLESYRKVCSCVNVPQYVQNMSKWSMKNHHNDVLAYYQPDCSTNKWNPELIPAGHHYNGANSMNSYKETDIETNTIYKIRSFGPDPNSAYFQTSCKLEYQFVKLQREQKDHFDKLTQLIIQLQQQFQNCSAQIKSDLHEIIA